MTGCKNKNTRILTIPNLLSAVRILLIPFCIWLYSTGSYGATAVLVVLSAVTDVVDGFIARRFDMVSDLGKILDPIADKLTQLTVLICLLTRFPLMWVPLVLLVIKELCTAVTGLLSVKKTGVVNSAVWHGKLTTATLYATMLLHLVWYDIPFYVSAVCIGMCVALMLFSFVMYNVFYISSLLKK